MQLTCLKPARPPHQPVRFPLLAGLILALVAGSALNAGATVTDICIARIGGATFITGKTEKPDGRSLAATIKDANGTALGTDVVDDNGKVRVSIGNSVIAPGDSLTIEITDVESSDVICTTTFTVPDPISSATFNAPGPIVIPSTVTFTASSPVTIIDLVPLTITVPLTGTIRVRFEATGTPGLARGTIEAVALTLPPIALPGGLTTGPNQVRMKDVTTFTLNLARGGTDGTISVRAQNIIGQADFDGLLGGDLDLQTGVWNVNGAGDVCDLAVPIPTLTEWGLITLVVLMAGTGIVMLRRQRAGLTA